MSDVRQRLERARGLAPMPDEPFERLLRRRDRRRRNHRIAAASVGLALAAGLAGALLVVVRGGEPATVPGAGEEVTPAFGPDDTEALDLALDPGEYYYQRVVVIFPGGRVEEETWWGLDGSGRRRVLQSDPGYGFGPEGVFGAGEFLYIESDLSDLPAEPEGFMAALVERSQEDGASPQAPYTPDPGDDPFSGELWRAVERLVELPDFTPDLRATLFVVVASLPGAEVTEGVADPVGRPATRVAARFGDGVFELYFDPATRQVLARAGHTADTNQGYYEIWVSSGIVPSTDDVPDGDEALIPESAEPLPTA